MSIDQLDELDTLLAFTEALVREPLAPPRPVEPRPPVRRPPVVWPAADREATRHRPRRWRRVVAVPVMVTALAALPTIAPRVRVDINGTAVELHARPVSALVAIRRAGLEPVDGALLSVVGHRMIDSHFSPATVTRNGRIVTWSANVHDGDRLQLTNGRTVREGTEARRVSVDGGGLPAVEYGLWNPPKEGITDEIVGVRSGEVVSETPAVAPVAATPVTAPVVALTFDDGPNPASTPAILAILKAANIKATFCIVGYAAKRYPALVKAVHDDGHVLCNHSMHHTQNLGKKSADVITAEVRDDSDTIAAAAGSRPLFFRSPGGSWTQSVVDEVRNQGMRALGWNVDPNDYTRPGPSVILARILAHVRPGAVILMHDGGGDRSQTVAQLPALIDRLRKMGYGFAVPTPVTYNA